MQQKWYCMKFLQKKKSTFTKWFENENLISKFKSWTVSTKRQCENLKSEIWLRVTLNKIWINSYQYEKCKVYLPYGLEIWSS